jgi:hypothetical protein
MRSVVVCSKTMGEERCVWVTIKSALPSLGATMLVALVLKTPCVEELALPKSNDSGNLSLTKLVIRRGRSS